MNLVSRAISHLKNTKSSEMVTFETARVSKSSHVLTVWWSCSIAAANKVVPVEVGIEMISNSVNEKPQLCEKDNCAAAQF